jgi:hypothetical protein
MTRPINQALEECDSYKTPNYTAIANKYGVNRSTLSRNHRGITVTRA